MVELNIYLSIPMEIIFSLLLNLLIIYYCIVAFIELTKYVYCEWQAFISKFAKQPQGRMSHSYRTDPRNRYLQGDLLILVKGDVATAKRLLAQQRRKNPGKSDNWYLEKVIYDLERDRRR
ncbi:hypothetical protein [Tolypothrix sp. PCC 7601]|uniref:hypothetical protein n=1 Tax=Tolypothrix sp. PCC 7601 TaxID=1188 RepID=UPI0005EAB17B|nr:hypothetical protein [Tolypothrix sp. PCC 7601]EKE98970.1 hypothetical protein FDUTEX481_03158 [Tolypothrix sp. PCC 7601]BAY94784.1 hypothetical protein NIES3275_68380 [Microchaete diplosiphon NIES-3275]